MENFWPLVEQFGLPMALLVAFIYGFHRGWWVQGSYHREIVTDLRGRLIEKNKENDTWRDTYLRTISVAQSALGLASGATEPRALPKPQFDPSPSAPATSSAEEPT